MALMEWDEKIFSVGIKKMDEQHKKLVGLINALDSSKSSKDRAFLDKVLNTLIDYTKTHFEDEEKLMKKMGFKNFDSHKIQHQKFAQVVERVQNSFNKNPDTEQALIDILEFLRDWLINHIVVEDKAYGDFLVS